MRFRAFPGAVLPFDRVGVLIDGIQRIQVPDADQVGEEWLIVPDATGVPISPGAHLIEFQYEYNPFNVLLASIPVDPDRDGAVWIDNVEILPL